MKLSLRQRLFVVAAVALLPAIAMLAVNELALRREREAEIHSLALRNSQQAAAELQRILDGTQILFVAASSAPVVQRLDAEGCNAYLAVVERQVPSLNRIAVSDLDGRLRCTSDGNLDSVSMGDRSYFQEALAKGDFVIGEFTTSKINGKAVLPVAMAIRDANGAVQGVIAGGILLDWLQERIRERGLSRGSALTVADRSGVIIAREPFPERFLGTRIPETFQTLVRGREAGTMELLSQDGTVRIIGYKPVTLAPVGLYVSSGISKAEAMAPINRATTASLTLIGAGAVLVAALTWLVGIGFVRRPVDRLLHVVKAWREGRIDARTGMNSGDGEIEAVGAALDQMLDEIRASQSERDRAEEQRQLLMHEMAHRIKNTLTVVQALARQKHKDEPGGGAAIAFEERIMALAAAYDVLLADDWTSAKLERVVTAALRPYAPESDGRFVASGPATEVTAPAALALSLTLHELCTNALKYGALSTRAGRVEIVWTRAEAPDGERVRLVWRERDGPPVATPARTGFGTKLISRAFPASLAARVETRFEATGVVCTIDFLLSPATTGTGGERQAVA